MKKKKKKLLLAAAILSVTSLSAVIFNAGAYQGTAMPWLLGNSISWYVGSQAWSAILFALGNLAVAILIGQYLWMLGKSWQMSRIYFYFIFLVIVALIWLSVFPLGFFDTPTSKSTISYFHEAGSRTMFFAMAVTAFLLALKSRSCNLLCFCLSIFVLYAIASAVAVLAGVKWFLSGLLFFEAFYIVAFLILLFWCGSIAPAQDE